MYHRILNALSKATTLREWLIITLTLQLILSGLALCLNRPFLAEGPGMRTAESAVMLYEQGTFSSPDFYELYDELIEKSVAEKSTYWQDVFAINLKGQLLPVHAPFMAICSLPFYSVFGYFGFLVFNQLVALTFFACFYVLIAQYLHPQKVSRIVYLLFITTPFLFYCHAYSYDLLAATLILGGLVLIPKQGYLAGLMLASASLIRPSNVFYLPLLFSAPRSSNFKNMGQALLASGIVILGFLDLNYYLFGNPLVTTRDRMPLFVTGAIELRSVELSLEILKSNWLKKLFDPQIGLVTWSPIIALTPLAFYNLRNTLNFKTYLLWLVVCVIQILIIFSYASWNEAGLGNRYLLPASALLGVLVMIYLHKNIISPRCENQGYRKER